MAVQPEASATPDAAVYLRISDDRGGAGLGIDRQREDCEALCARLGWEVGDVFPDNDLSAFSGKRRPQYERMLEALKDGRCGAVVAWHPDRLHRSPVELERFIGVVEATGAAVATCQAGEYDLSTATGRMTARVVGAVARQESELKSERVRSQREQAAKKGRPHVGGRRAYGYDVPRGDDGKPKGTGELVVVEAEAAMIREAVERVLGGESLRTVARDWNARCVTSARGGQWTITSLRTMLTGPHLAGQRVHHGDVIGDTDAPAIITRDEHEQLRALLGNPRTRRRGRPAETLLGGLLICGRCGGKMHHSRRTDGRRRYMCSVKPGYAGCGRAAIAAEGAEAVIAEAVVAALDTPALSQELSAASPGGGDIAALEERLDELADAYGSGQITKREWMRARNALDARLDQARGDTERAAARSTLAPYAEPGALRRAWPDLTVDQRRGILGAVITDIVVLPVEDAGRDPADRLQVNWRA